MILSDRKQSALLLQIKELASANIDENILNLALDTKTSQSTIQVTIVDELAIATDILVDVSH